jgi:Flp pilus assembly protein TadD
MNSFKKFLLAILVTCIFVVARAQDEQYVVIYNTIQEADAAAAADPLQALNKYLKAQSDLQQFQKVYPEWNTRIVGYRLNYLANKIAELSAHAPAAKAVPAKTPAAVQPATPATPAAQTPAPAPANDIQNQLNALRDQIRQLQSDNALLQAKVREAFSAQPAAVDSRELAKANNQIKSLTKENDLLKTTLTQEKAKPANAADSREMERIKQQLADSAKSLSEQTTRANSLAQEKLELQNQLLALQSGAKTSADSDTIKQALSESDRKLNEQLKLTALLQSDNAALQKRVSELTLDAGNTAALREENAVLKKQLAEARLAGSDETARKLAEAQAQIAALQSDKEVLRVQNQNLAAQVRQLTLANVVLTQGLDSGRMKQLVRERDDLRSRLAAAEGELSTRKNKNITMEMDQLHSQIELLRTRLAVYEAPAVPYTKDELALFSGKTEQMAISVNPGFEKKSVKDLPPGAMALVDEAQRDFALGRYADAEKKYLQVLKQDEKNIYTLANLAAIELELNQLDNAQKHVETALSVAPNDAYSLSILGNLKFRQGKYDEAFDALARAAKLDPKNAEIQNHLGLVLSQKGMRKEAETALRTAVELDPNYASAHNNLAVIYITQKPPSPALARWHYDKARALGMPANPQLEKLLDANSTATAQK